MMRSDSSSTVLSRRYRQSRDIFHRKAQEAVSKVDWKNQSIAPITLLRGASLLYSPFCSALPVELPSVLRLTVIIQQIEG